MDNIYKQFSFEGGIFLLKASAINGVFLKSINLWMFNLGLFRSPLGNPAFTITGSFF